MSTGSAQAIDIADLTVAYRDKPVLWDVDLQVPEGVLCAIVGPNGAGKTTLIKAALGLIDAAAGRVDISVVERDGVVHIDVRDDGRGFDTGQDAAGFGLIGMRERVARHGGLLRAGPAAGRSGFAVSAFLPYAAAPGVDPDHVHA